MKQFIHKRKTVVFLSHHEIQDYYVQLTNFIKTVSYHHVKYEFQNPHTIVSLNVKELLAQSRLHIWSLIGRSMILTRNHLVRKQTLNHLAKLPASSKAFLDIQANYRVSIHFETRTWDDNKIQSNALTKKLNHLSQFGYMLRIRLRTKWLWIWIAMLPLR